MKAENPQLIQSTMIVETDLPKNWFTAIRTVSIEIVSGWPEEKKQAAGIENNLADSAPSGALAYSA